MRPYEVETLRGILHKKLRLTSSSQQKLLLINQFFSQIIPSTKSFITETYVFEFIDYYVKYLNRFEAFSLRLEITEEIFKTTKQLIQLGFLNDFKFELTSNLIRIEKDYKTLKEILKGKNKEINSGFNKICFPILEEKIDELDIPITGILETITVNIKKSDDENKFIIVPSGKEIEERIINQIETSWKLALKYSSKYVKKISKHHQIIINFDKKAGFYVGNSLGIALTVGFIEEILKYYNSPTIVNIKEKIAISGGLNKKCEVKNVNKETLDTKVETVFYSDIELFVIPKPDEEIAAKKLNELKEKFPERNLRLITVETFDDLLNRRDLVDIKKQKIVVRSINSLKRNWKNVAALFLILFSFGGYLLLDYDDNPAILEIKGQLLLVKNKEGETLWTRKVNYGISNENEKQTYKIAQKIVDIDENGENEVFLARELFEDDNDPRKGRIVCLDKSGKKIWDYKFQDTIKALKESFDNQFQNYFFHIDTSKNIIYCLAQNLFYPSAIYKLDLQTGKRIPGTLWNAGHFHDGAVGDFNNDGKKELVATGIHNGFECAFVLSINLENLNGATPSTGRYIFPDHKVTDFNKVVLIPKLDITVMSNERFNSTFKGGLYFRSDNKFYISVNEAPMNNYDICIMYIFNSNLSDFEPKIGDKLHVYRDKLINEGKIEGPKTNTSEFIEMVKNNILYWNGKEFVHKNEL